MGKWVLAQLDPIKCMAAEFFLLALLSVMSLLHPENSISQLAACLLYCHANKSAKIVFLKHPGFPK
jgi:hypothetical protein